MSIDDREWFARETLRRMGIRADGEAGPPPDAGPFNINLRHAHAKRRADRRAWLRLLLWAVCLAAVAVALLYVDVAGVLGGDLDLLDHRVGQRGTELGLELFT